MGDGDFFEDGESMSYLYDRLSLSLGLCRTFPYESIAQDRVSPEIFSDGFQKTFFCAESISCRKLNQVSTRIVPQRRTVKSVLFFFCQTTRRKRAKLSTVL